jgi:hypothetical protein
MIGELPDPTCVGASSPLRSSIRKSRGEFDARYAATGSFKTANVPVTGVGFFDFNHGQTGVAAPNAIELHAVLNVQFGWHRRNLTVTHPKPQPPRDAGPGSGHPQGRSVDRRCGKRSTDGDGERLRA